MYTLYSLFEYFAANFLNFVPHLGCFTIHQITFHNALEVKRRRFKKLPSAKLAIRPGKFGQG